MTGTRSSLPEIIDLRLLGQCDLACPYCFGPRHELRAMPTPEVLRILDIAGACDVHAVVFSGGEPSLIRDLPLMLQHAQNLGLRTVLSTNGIVFRRRMRELAPLLDWIGLPLDAADREVNRVMRPGKADQWSEVVACLREVRDEYPDVGIKLGTVACALNVHDIRHIPEVLGGFRPDTWKIYQVVYSSYGGDNKAVLELSDSAFEELIAELTPVAADWGVPLVAYHRRTRPGRYLFIEPNGDAQVATLDSEVTIGNLLEDPEPVLTNWTQFVDEVSLKDNFSETYSRRVASRNGAPR